MWQIWYKCCCSYYLECVDRLRTAKQVDRLRTAKQVDRLISWQMAYRCYNKNHEYRLQVKPIKSLKIKGKPQSMVRDHEAVSSNLATRTKIKKTLRLQDFGVFFFLRCTHGFLHFGGKPCVAGNYHKCLSKRLSLHSLVPNDQEEDKNPLTL